MRSKNQKQQESRGLKLEMGFKPPVQDETLDYETGAKELLNRIAAGNIKTVLALYEPPYMDYYLPLLQSPLVEKLFVTKPYSPKIQECFYPFKEHRVFDFVGNILEIDMVLIGTEAATERYLTGPMEPYPFECSLGCRQHEDVLRVLEQLNLIKEGKTQKIAIVAQSGLKKNLSFIDSKGTSKATDLIVLPEKASSQKQASYPSTREKK